MEPLDDLASVSATQGIDFILCGGHAVNAYQVIRKTGDVDLVVRERDLRRWRDQLVALGYSVFHEDRPGYHSHPAWNSARSLVRRIG